METMSGELDTSSQGALDRARKENWRVVVPTAFELQIDIDSDEAFKEFELRFSKASELGFVSGFSSRPSKSGTEGRYHVTVKTPLKIESATERIALQAILGSDWLRELRGLHRVYQGEAIPTLFFEGR
jgi:hypothetical protein